MSELRKCDICSYNEILFINKRNELLTHMTKLMNLKNIMQSWGKKARHKRHNLLNNSIYMKFTQKANLQRQKVD